MADSANNRHKYHLNLKSLKVFEACARHHSFAAAAEELCVTQSAVSKQMQKLQEDFGIALFIHDGFANQLSPAGRRLAAHLSNTFQDLDNLVGQLVAGHIDAPLVVSCEPTICLKFLIPCLPEILSDSGLEVHVLSGGGALDFRRHRVDLAIRRNDFSIDPSLDVQTIGSEYVGPVVASDISKSKTEVRIHARTRPDAWLQWQEQTGNSSYEGDIFYEHHFQVLEAVESGQGAGLMSLHMVSRLLQRGTLLAPRGFVADGSKYVALSADSIAEDGRKVKFCTWLRQKFQENAALFEVTETKY